MKAYKLNVEIASFIFYALAILHCVQTTKKSFFGEICNYTFKLLVLFPLLLLVLQNSLNKLFESIKYKLIFVVPTELLSPFKVSEIPVLLDKQNIVRILQFSKVKLEQVGVASWELKEIIL